MTITRLTEHYSPSLPGFSAFAQRNEWSRAASLKVPRGLCKLKSCKNFRHEANYRVEFSARSTRRALRLVDRVTLNRQARSGHPGSVDSRPCEPGWRDAVRGVRMTPSRHQPTRLQPKGPVRRWNFAWMLLLLAGCMSLSPQQYSAWRMTDTPGPLGAQDEQVTLRPRVAEPGVGTNTPKRSTSPLPGATLPETESESRRSERTMPILPKIEPEGITVPTKVELTVEAPARRPVGGNATYRVTVRNSGDKPVEKIAVHCQFDGTLIFSGSDRKEVVRRIGELLPGESEEVALTLTTNEIGSHCCRFRARSEDSSVTIQSAEKEVCIEFVPRFLDINLVGPTQRTEGSRAEFTFSVVNRSIRALKNLRIGLTYDAALVAKEASQEVEHEAGSLTWKLDELRPMEGVHFQVEYLCRSTAHRACVTGTVTGKDLTDEQAESCLEIVRVPGTLDLRISDAQDPLEIGKPGEYVLTVQNIGLQPAEKVQLELFPPENVKVLSATVKQGETPVPLKLQPDGRKLVFDIVPQLAPNAELTYTIRVEGTKPGLAEMRATLTSSLTQTAVSTAEPTLIVEP